MVRGYKCFDKDLRNRYGMKFEVGRIYFAQGIIKFGNNGNGYHMCKNMEDTFRYFDLTNNNISICEVIGDGNITEYNDEYNGYYDMYAVSQMQILKKLSHSEIIDYGLNLSPIRAKRFIQFFNLTKEEIERFKERYKKDEAVINAITYYQEKDKEVYIRRLK